MKHKEIFALAVNSANVILASQTTSFTELSQKRVLHKLVKETYVQLYLVEKEILKEKKSKSIATSKPIATSAPKLVETTKNLATKRRVASKKTTRKQ